MKKIAALVLALTVFLSSRSDLLPQTKAADDGPNFVFAEKCVDPDLTKCPLLETSSGDKISFPRTLKEGDKVDLLLFLKNDGGQNVITVRSWLKYDTSVLKALDLSDDKSDFPLAAPDGNKIDADAGQIQIGRGVSGGGNSGKLLLIATVEFQVVSPQKRNTTVSFVNFQKDDLGETGAFILNAKTFQPENILPAAPKSLTIPLNGQGATPPNDGGSTPGPDQTSTPGTTTPPPNTNTGELARPTGLRVEALTESTNLIWNLSPDTNVRGYFVYYSENSGFYIRRKDVGRTNYQELKDLKKNTKYYFAVTAYDANGKESDYSDEVFATIGVPGSESHPFKIGQTGSDTESIDTPTTPKSTHLSGSGPADSMGIGLSLCGAFLLFYSFRKLRRSALFS